MRISDWSSDVCSSDGIPIAEIALDDVTVTADSLLGGAGSGAGVLERVFEEANAALAAEAVGIMSETLDLTVDYLKTRHQFGVPIARSHNRESARTGKMV